MRTAQEVMVERRIQAIEIGQQAAVAGACVARPARSRYVVMVSGQVYDVGGRHMSVVTAQARVFNLVLGRSDVAPCSHCGQRPRMDGSSWCRECKNEGSAARMQEVRAERRRMA